MTVDGWPAGDRDWAARYRAALVGKQVPASARSERERDLLSAVRRTGLPADELFGDATELAREDADDLASRLARWRDRPAR